MMRMSGINKAFIIILFILIVPAYMFADNMAFRINGKIDSSYNGTLVTLFTFVPWTPLT